MIKKFENYSLDIETDTIFNKNHQQWASIYPELKLFNLETDYSNNKLVWFYTFNKSLDSFNFDLFIEIKKGSTWEISFELTQVSSDETDYKSEQQKHYNKGGMTVDKFQAELSRICKYIRTWNEDMFKVLKSYPLIDSE